MQKCRIKTILMGSDTLSIPAFQAIYEDPRIEIVGVFTQPDRPSGRGQQVHVGPVKAWALECGLTVLQPERIKEAQTQWILDSGASVAFVKAYGMLLRQYTLDAFPLGVWNFHVSILPAFRGTSPIVGTIASGDAFGGVSLMKLVLKMDAGPVLDIEKVPLAFDEIQTTLSLKLAHASERLVKNHLGKILSGHPLLQEQDISKVSFVRRLTKEDANLDWSTPAIELERRIRALMPWPGCVLSVGCDRLKIGLPLSVDCAPCAEAPGTVLGPRGGYLWIATSKGSLGMGALQRPGGKLLPIKEFLLGYSIPKGTQCASSPMVPLFAPEPF